MRSRKSCASLALEMGFFAIGPCLVAVTLAAICCGRRYAAPDVKSVVFQAVMIPQLRFYARYRIRKLGKLPTLTGIRQCAPVPTTASGDDCYSGITQTGSNELLVEVPDQLVSGSNFLGHVCPRVLKVNLAEAIQLHHLFHADKPCGHSWTADNDRTASCRRRLEDRHSGWPFAPDRNAKRAGHSFVCFAVSGSSFLNNPEDRPVFAGRPVFAVLAGGTVATVLAILRQVPATTGKRNAKQRDAGERKYRFHLVVPIFDRILPAKMTANGRLAEVS
ncbi:hypothetical protein [Tardiphaga sp. 619_E2_N8_5]|uniref:hypothetical protein n=1 Tax=unclassified Tardiphaga TaxID=2631404 RepID=UPI003F2071CD